MWIVLRCDCRLWHTIGSLVIEARWIAFLVRHGLGLLRVLWMSLTSAHLWKVLLAVAAASQLDSTALTLSDVHQREELEASYWSFLSCMIPFELESVCARSSRGCSARNSEWNAPRVCLFAFSYFRYVYPAVPMCSSITNILQKVCL
jgi:hypothetical protein